MGKSSSVMFQQGDSVILFRNPFNEVHYTGKNIWRQPNTKRENIAQYIATNTCSARFQNVRQNKILTCSELEIMNM